MSRPQEPVDWTALQRIAADLNAEEAVRLKAMEPMIVNAPILGFTGKYRFLSNFFQFEGYYWDNSVFASAEHAYQTLKCCADDNKGRDLIRGCKTPGQAKRMGRKITLRADWEYFKLYAMLRIIQRKFGHQPLQDMLLATGERPLVEINDWHDNFWGSCACGKCRTLPKLNHLGNILQIVRDEYRRERGKL